MAKEDENNKIDKDSTEYRQKMFDRSEALADSLIDVFGYTDAQLVSQLTLSAITERLIADKLDGKYEPPTEDELNRPMDVATENNPVKHINQGKHHRINYAKFHIGLE